MIDLSALPERERQSAKQIHLRLTQGENITLMSMLGLKSAVKEQFGTNKGFELYKQIVAPTEKFGLCKQRVVSQLKVAESEACAMHVADPGGEDVELLPPRIVGESNAKALCGSTRRVFVACFPNSTAFSRSSTIRLSDGTFAFDVQEGELGTIPADYAFDPVVFHCESDTVHCIHDSRPTTCLRLPEALSLLGSGSASFGHWMFEEYFKFLTARRFPEVRKVPILIDAGIPKQHLQSLVALTGPDHPIIEVPHFMRVEVDRLWVVSNCIYSPKIVLTLDNFEPRGLAFSARFVAQVFQEAWEELDARIGQSTRNKAIFLSRDPHRYRHISNHAETASLLADQGYHNVRPETLTFEEQFALYRSCDRVVVQSGSASSGLFMCKPETQICLLSHGYIPAKATWGQLMAELGVDATIFVTDLEDTKGRLADRSSYSVDIGTLEKFLVEMQKGNN